MDKEYLKSIKEQTLANKRMFESILSKSKEQLEQEDFIKCNEAIDEYNEILKSINELEEEKRKIEKRFKDLEKDIKQFPLLKEEEIISLEEKNSLQCKLDEINNIINDDELNSIKQLKSETAKLVFEYDKEQIEKKLLEKKDMEIVYTRYSGPVLKTIAECYNYEYTSFDECTLDEKQKIREYEGNIEKIRSSEEGEYDKKGKFDIYVEKLPNYGYGGTIELELTPREMAEIGIVYTDKLLRWKSNEQKELEERLKSRDVEAIKDVLLNGDSEIVHIYSEISPWSKGAPSFNMARPKKVFDLGKFNIGMPGQIYIGAQGGGDIAYINKYKTDDSELISERKKQIESLAEKVKNDKKGKYDKPGIISIPTYKTNDGAAYESPKAYIDGKINIEISQKELIDAGILPEDFGWKKKTRISSKDIAQADKEQGFTQEEISSLKVFMDKIMGRNKEKVKNND